MIREIPGISAWVLMGFGISYLSFGIWNDLNWGAPWACPGPFYTATNALECITEGTLLVEIPIGAALIIIGLIVYFVDRMYIKKG